MKVKTLIECLQRYDPNLEVTFGNEDFLFNIIGLRRALGTDNTNQKGVLWRETHYPKLPTQIVVELYSEHTKEDLLL